MEALLSLRLKSGVYCIAIIVGGTSSLRHD
jgi:hypothetical protein